MAFRQQSEGTERILGVDTALRTTGFGVVDTDGRRFSIVDCGVIRTERKQPLSVCLQRLSQGVLELVELYAPQTVGIEGAFFFRNAKTALLLGMARGAVVAALTGAGLPIYEYAPRRVKQAVCGYGNASKEQVALLMSQILGIRVDEIPHDATDALAIAVCHGQTAHAAQGLVLPAPL